MHTADVFAEHLSRFNRCANELGMTEPEATRQLIADVNTVVSKMLKEYLSPADTRSRLRRAFEPVPRLASDQVVLLRGELQASLKALAAVV